MKKESIAILAQLLTSMKEATLRAETAINRKNIEELNLAKKEILDLYAQINKLL